MIVAQGKTRVEAWLDAVEKINPRKDGGREYNVVVEVEQPSFATTKSRQAEKLVNDALIAREKQPLITVADTIFPMTEYVQGGMPQVYQYPEAIFENIKSAAGNGWGSYALRLTKRPSKNGPAFFNPLEAMIDKMRVQLKGQRKRCFYELDTTMPVAELKLYEADDDKKKTVGTQCLSHLSFKFGKEDSLYLTAMYRSQHFMEKALGNYRGLAGLQAAVAKELSLTPGPLVVHATYACYDVAAVGGLQAALKLVKACRALLPKDNSNAAQ
jgi:hypothetical protein